MTAFVLYRAKGEIYDYDFSKKHRDYKLERERFSYGDFPVEAVCILPSKLLYWG